MEKEIESRRQIISNLCKIDEYKAMKIILSKNSFNKEDYIKFQCIIDRKLFISQNPMDYFKKKYLEYGDEYLLFDLITNKTINPISMMEIFMKQFEFNNANYREYEEGYHYLPTSFLFFMFPKIEDFKLSISNLSKEKLYNLHTELCRYDTNEDYNNSICEEKIYNTNFLHFGVDINYFNIRYFNPKLFIPYLREIESKLSFDYHEKIIPSRFLDGNKFQPLMPFISNSITKLSITYKFNSSIQKDKFIPGPILIPVIRFEYYNRNRYHYVSKRNISYREIGTYYFYNHKSDFILEAKNILVLNDILSFNELTLIQSKYSSKIDIFLFINKQCNIKLTEENSYAYFLGPESEIYDMRPRKESYESIKLR